MRVNEWVGFNYQQYKKDIDEFIDSDEFVNREYTGFKFTNKEQTRWEETNVKYSLKDNLSNKQVGALRGSIKEGLDQEKRLVDIQDDILQKVKPSDTVTDKNGVKRKISPQVRAAQMARSETVRASNEGALRHFDRGGVKLVGWVTSPGERTCNYCYAQDGKVLPITEATNKIPAHTGCRCTWFPITGETGVIPDIEKVRKELYE